jgi:hypothetical protein
MSKVLLRSVPGQGQVLRTPTPAARARFAPSVGGGGEASLATGKLSVHVHRHTRSPQHRQRFLKLESRQSYALGSANCGQSLFALRSWVKAVQQKPTYTQVFRAAGFRKRPRCCASCGPTGNCSAGCLRHSCRSTSRSPPGPPDAPQLASNGRANSSSQNQRTPTPALISARIRPNGAVGPDGN